MKRAQLIACAGGALLAFAAPVAANEFDHVWTCELNPGKSINDARAVSLGWLQAARTMKGGEQLQVYLNYPIVLSSSGSRFDFVVRSPSLAAWGTFYDGYDPGSAVGKADEAFAEVATCSGSTMWESIKVE